MWKCELSPSCFFVKRWKGGEGRLLSPILSFQKKCKHLIRGIIDEIVRIFYLEDFTGSIRLEIF